VWTELGLGVALGFGGIRALELWRAQGDFRATNVVVMRTLLEGRGRDLPELLAKSGPSLYVQVARAILTPPDKLWASADEDAASMLKRDSELACVHRIRHLERGLWLEMSSWVGIATAAAGLFFEPSESRLGGLGLVAASLLIIANQRASRAVRAGALVGAAQLVDALLASMDAVRQQNQVPVEPEAKPKK